MDSKNIKDYLHLYLGQQCRCFNHADSEGWIETISCSIIIDYEDEDSEIEGIVPILRPLSDMTEEEMKSVGHMPHVPLHKDDLKYAIIRNSWPPEQTRYLLSRGFDLFNLIESGLAIKKSS